ncbi:MAG: hypothetical protein WC455_14765 [Dehalococcoidia bacterium]|jgi:peptidoglycan hydrolase CwlO-like protein
MIVHDSENGWSNVKSVSLSILAAALFGLIAWQFNDGVARAQINTRQDEQIKALQERFSSMDNKLDKILEEIRQDNKRGTHGP